MAKSTENSTKYKERKQRELDKLYASYEDGIELAPGLFPISHFYASRMAKVVFKEELGDLNNKFLNFNYMDLDGIEVAFGVTIVKIKKKYFLEYKYDEAIETFIERWLNINVR